MKKRPYLLLELIIAVALVGVFSYFFIRYPCEQLQEEWKVLKKVEEERKWDITLMNLRLQAHEGTPSWLTSKKPVKIDDYKITILSKGNEEMKYFLVKVERKKDEEEIIYRFCVDKKKAA